MTDDELDVLVRDHYARMEPPRRLTRRLLPARRGVEGWMVGLAVAAVLGMAAWPMLGPWLAPPEVAHVAGAVPAAPARPGVSSEPEVSSDPEVSTEREAPKVLRVPEGQRAVSVNALVIAGWPRVGDVIELYRQEKTGHLVPAGVQGEVLEVTERSEEERSSLIFSSPPEPLGAMFMSSAVVVVPPAVSVVRSTALREVLLPWPEGVRPLPRGVHVTLGAGGVPVDALDPAATDQFRARILDHPRPDLVLVEVSAADAPRAIRLVVQ